MRRAIFVLLLGACSHVTLALAQDVTLPPTYGTINNLVTTHTDTIAVRVMAGGDIDARRLGGNCVGMIANPPDVRLNYRAGRSALVITARSFADTTLIVNLPNGQWLCNDDLEGLNPGLVLNDAPSGQYDIWVGTFGRERAAAELRIYAQPAR
jgi:hypothetical protein